MTNCTGESASTVKQGRRLRQKGEACPRRYEERYLTRDEVWQLIDAVKHTSAYPKRDTAMLTLMYQHGLRVSELINLKRSDIKAATKGRPWVLKTARGKGSEEVKHKMLAESVEALRAYRKEFPENYDYRGCEFITRRGSRMTRQNVNAIVKKAGAYAGLGHCNPHQLRHAVGWTAVNSDVAMAITSKYLGHVRMKTTEGYCDLDERRFDVIQAQLGRP